MQSVEIIKINHNYLNILESTIQLLFDINNNVMLNDKILIFIQQYKPTEFKFEDMI